MVPHELLLPMIPHEGLSEGSKHRSMKNIVAKVRNAVRFPSYEHSNLCLPFFCMQSSCSDKGKCSCGPPSDVPQGFIAMCVGREQKRFVIPTVYLNHPAFHLLLEKSEEEFGLHQKGVIRIPLEVLLFEKFLWLVGHGDPAPQDAGIEELEHYYREKYDILVETIHFDD